jgi:IstB-like ATP binding protein
VQPRLDVPADGLDAHSAVVVEQRRAIQDCQRADVAGPAGAVPLQNEQVRCGEAVHEHAAEGLYRLVDAAYEKRSVAVSSNLHPAAFDELMPNTLATATVDRLLHHAHICQTSGDSVRPSQAPAGQGVRPLA